MYTIIVPYFWKYIEQFAYNFFLYKIMAIMLTN